MAGIERRRRRTRGGATGTRSQLGPTPRDIAELNGTFAMTSSVQDPQEPPGQSAPRPHPELEPPSRSGATGGAEPTRLVDTGTQGTGHLGDVNRDDAAAERGLRGLIGGGSSQVTATAAMRARDAARPTPEDLAASESELVIVRRGWVPREELPRLGRQR